jgi:hypothetical protein
MLHCRQCPLHSWEICMLELQPEPKTVSNNSCVLSLPRIVLPADFSAAPPCFGASIMKTSDTDSYICCARFVHMYITLCIWYNWYNWYNCNVHNIDTKKKNIYIYIFMTMICSLYHVYTMYILYIPYKDVFFLRRLCGNGEASWAAVRRAGATGRAGNFRHRTTSRWKRGATGAPRHENLIKCMKNAWKMHEKMHDTSKFWFQNEFLQKIIHVRSDSE